MAKNLLDVDVAMRRLSYLVKRKGNIDDKEAYNSVVKFLRTTQEYQTDKYPLLSRLFCYIFLARFRFAQQEGENITANTILGHIYEVIQKPLEWWIDDIAFETKMLRYEVAYKDYERGLREAKRIAEANKTPAEEITSLKDEYRPDDIARVIKERGKIIDEKMKDAITALTKEYKHEDIEYFIKSEITKLSLLCH
jgi:hypothetical protein